MKVDPKLKKLIREGYFNALQELGQGKDHQVLATSSEETLSKFPKLKETIKDLFTDEYAEFIKQIDWIAPRPSTFRVILKSGQDFSLKWTGKTFQAQILGKRYYLSLAPEFQQALDKIGLLLKDGPVKGADNDPDKESGEGEGEVDFGGDTGGGNFPEGDDSGAAPEFGDEAPAGNEEGEEESEDLSGEDITFQEPDENPDI